MGLGPGPSSAADRLVFRATFSMHLLALGVAGLGHAFLSHRSDDPKNGHGIVAATMFAQGGHRVAMQWLDMEGGYRSWNGRGAAVIALGCPLVMHAAGRGLHVSWLELLGVAFAFLLVNFTFTFFSDFERGSRALILLAHLLAIPAVYPPPGMSSTERSALLAFGAVRRLSRRGGSRAGGGADPVSVHAAHCAGRRHPAEGGGGGKRGARAAAHCTGDGDCDGGDGGGEGSEADRSDGRGNGRGDGGGHADGRRRKARARSREGFHAVAREADRRSARAAKPPPRLGISPSRALGVRGEACEAGADGLLPTRGLEPRIFCRLRKRRRHRLNGPPPLGQRHRARGNVAYTPRGRHGGGGGPA